MILTIQLFNNKNHSISETIVEETLTNKKNIVRIIHGLIRTRGMIISKNSQLSVPKLLIASIINPKTKRINSLMSLRNILSTEIKIPRMNFKLFKPTIVQCLIPVKLQGNLISL